MKKILMVFALATFFFTNAQKHISTLFVGTYTNDCDSKGIYTYRFNSITGECVLKQSTEKCLNPSYISLSEDKKKLYAVNENANESTLSSFDYESQSGKLLTTAVVNAAGADPCYVINDDQNIITANYSSGNIVVYAKNASGGISAIKQNLQHFGSSINTKRQNSAHLHMVKFSNDKKYVFATDLGTDRIYVYEYFPAELKNVLVLKNTVNVKKGGGPRHLELSKNGKFVYILNELSGEIAVYEFKSGSLLLRSTSTILDKNYGNEPRAADIHLSADNKFLYASNRETANDISVFKILNNGKLKFIAKTPTQGVGPRNFTIDPTGNFLLVANRKTNEIVVFKRNQKTGLLTFAGQKISVCSPVCLVF